MIGVIGGTGVYDLLGDAASERTATTEHGTISARIARLGSGRQVAFAPRHGSNHSVPPHRLPSRALIAGLQKLGVSAILATSAVGSLRPDLKPGTFALLEQFIDFTKARPTTFFDGPRVVHVDMTEPYCPQLRQALRLGAVETGLQLWPEDVTYVCTEGPRFETPAEIRAYRLLGGDVVGMTQVPEAVLARELGICYASVALVTNLAAGVEGNRPSHAEVQAMMKTHGADLARLLLHTAEALDGERSCPYCPKPEVME